MITPRESRELREKQRRKLQIRRHAERIINPSTQERSSNETDAHVDDEQCIFFSGFVLSLFFGFAPMLLVCCHEHFQLHHRRLQLFVGGVFLGALVNSLVLVIIAVKYVKLDSVCILVAETTPAYLDKDASMWDHMISNTSRGQL